MATKSSFEYYTHFSEMSSLRAMAESAFNDFNTESRLFENPTMREIYHLASSQKGVTKTDLLLPHSIINQYELHPESTVLNDNHGKIVGRKANARRFFNHLQPTEKDQIEGVLREAIYEFSGHQRLSKDAIVGMNPQLMLKARLLTTQTNANNVFNWCCNFQEMETFEKAYQKSDTLELQDILIVNFPEWSGAVGEYKEGLVVVDPYENVIFILGLRYFGELKKGTLTLAWTSGLRLGMVACHGGIKEVDFTNTENPELGKRSISFFGLSGSGKSSHTNSLDNGGSLPLNSIVSIAHDDAFQIDIENQKCLVWEPSLFDKTDSREVDHPDWKYCIATQNHSVFNYKGNCVPYGRDLRNKNGRALFTREILGGHVENQVNFPEVIIWLMKDDTLPPILYLNDPLLAVAMGATLMTKRSAAENVSAEEMKKLVFEPYANPFRVYDLIHDCEGFHKVFQSGTRCFVFNSGNYFNGLDEDRKPIPLSLSLKLQTAILRDQLSYESFPFLKGASVPSESVDNIIWKHYQENYSYQQLKNRENYLEIMKDRFHQRRIFLQKTLNDYPEMLEKLLKSLVVQD